MKNASCLAVLALLFVANVNAEQSADGMKLNTPKDALLQIGKDNFGPVSLEKLIADINGDVVYTHTERFSQGRVEVESQNDPSHYGSVDFDFKKPFDFTRQEFIDHMTKVTGEPPRTSGTTLSSSWKTKGFSCMVDFDDSDTNKLFQYLCHHVGK